MTLALTDRNLVGDTCCIQKHHNPPSWLQPHTHRASPVIEPPHPIDTRYRQSCFTLFIPLMIEKRHLIGRNLVNDEYVSKNITIHLLVFNLTLIRRTPVIEPPN